MHKFGAKNIQFAAIRYLDHVCTTERYDADLIEVHDICLQSHAKRLNLKVGRLNLSQM